MRLSGAGPTSGQVADGDNFVVSSAHLLAKLNGRPG